MRARDQPVLDDIQISRAPNTQINYVAVGPMRPGPFDADTARCSHEIADIAVVVNDLTTVDKFQRSRTTESDLCCFNVSGGDESIDDYRPVAVHGLTDEYE